MSNFSTVDPSKVGFSEGARVFVGPLGAQSTAECTPVGLLGADATLNIEKTYRSKNDHFPEVEVVSALQSISASVNVVLREWKRENLLLAFDAGESDVTDVLAAPVTVEDEEHVVADNAIALKFAGATNVVVTKGGSPLVEDTDYTLAVVAGRTVVVAIDGGAIGNGDTLSVDYEYTPVAHTEIPIGRAGTRNYYTVFVEEAFTMSNTSKAVYQIYKAAIGLDGALSLNSADEGADLPVVIEGVLEQGRSEIGRLLNYA